MRTRWETLRFTEERKTSHGSLRGYSEFGRPEITRPSDVTSWPRRYKCQLKVGVWPISTATEENSHLFFSAGNQDS
jgi:hypothetical protein